MWSENGRILLWYLQVLWRRVNMLSHFICFVREGFRTMLTFCCVVIQIPKEQFHCIDYKISRLILWIAMLLKLYVSIYWVWSMIEYLSLKNWRSWQGFSLRKVRYVCPTFIVFFFPIRSSYMWCCRIGLILLLMLCFILLCDRK